MSFEEKIDLGYLEYLKLPKATVTNKNNTIYEKGWYIQTGCAIVSPHPHRHYTKIEFAYWCGKDATLYNQFIEPLNK
jgi:hypothetical protein